jgi:hypothetical protein
MKIVMLISLWLLAVIYTLYRHNKQQKKVKQIQSKTKELYEQKIQKRKDEK